MSEKQVHTFRGGVHPVFDGKNFASGKAIENAPPLAEYTLAISQNIGAPPELVVKVGDKVLKGQLIAQAKGFVSVPLHSPTSGTVARIEPVDGAMGMPVPGIVIAADGEDKAAEPMPPMDYATADPAAIRDRIRDAGIVGMGGAAFPTHVKLAPPPDKKIDCLILNGAECEPYLTSDHRTMLETPERVLRGAAAVARVLGVAEPLLGIESNKPDAIAALREHAAKYHVRVVELETRYPQGGEKQLIAALTGRKVPAGGLPMDVGCVVQNVGTAAAIADALDGIALFERVTTVTGGVVAHPGNFRLRLGTPVIEAIRFAGGVTEEPGKVLMGGPMMGFAQRSLKVPVCKNTSGIVLLSPRDVTQYESTGCIRCGRCLEVCPMHLMPSLLGSAVESEKYELAAQNYIMDCIECGACAYVCPAHRPLVQHIRRGKAELRRQKQAGKK